jgi:hypothetical protein
MSNKIGVLFNATYGGFQISREAISRYLDLKSKNGVDMSGVNPKFLAKDVDRTDEIMVSVVKELGDKANCRFSKIEIEYIPEKYKNHVSIGEYDGYETVRIDFTSYKLDRIRKILDKEGESTHKLQCIGQVLDEEEENWTD